ncbi:arfaptin-2-like isoform X2 [Pomacea canaliculata]|uniref:arfaptin-2-like isoform X2 n=1 Tax=Pomacea canaliculata TaxID=400727 RepID=UPI000D72A5E5|nr:arfaptin-2-like isoform X2 [Pomacea canaliculata]
MAESHPPQRSSEKEDDSFERDLEEMLDDGPSLNNAISNVQGGTPNTMSSSYSGSALSYGASGTKEPSLATQATSNIPLSGPQSNGDFVPKLNIPASAQSKLESLKDWSINTFKCTRQFLSERFGKGSRTVDLDMETKIEALRDTQRKYASILRLSRILTQHYFHVVQTQRALGEGFAELAQKSPELQEEFRYNSETQQALVKNGEVLLSALNFFTSSVNTLCNKTMEDTLLTIRNYESSRLEYDAYRNELETLQLGPRENASTAKVEESRRKYEDHKIKFERLRSDVNIKLKFLEENKVKVMHKQLLLFHNAISAYFSGNAAALEATLKQFNISLKRPNAEKPSWIEQ